MVKPLAAGLNHLDVWSTRGVGLPADRLPMIFDLSGIRIASTVSPSANIITVSSYG